MRRPTRPRIVPLAAASATVLAVAACGSTAATTTSSISSANPITVGISLPLSGDFAADGQASENGYRLWASDVNANGGLLGRPVRLKILNDNSDEKLVVSQYNELISQDHVDLTLAPFSTLLTADALKATAQHHYALPAGSATGGLVFGATGGPTYRNLFSVSVPVAVEMQPFARWVTTLPAAQRQTAAYPEIDDPFADPPVDTTRDILEHHGVRTVYPVGKVAPATTNAQIRAAAIAVAQQKPQIVVVGSVDLPSLLIFVHTFQAHNYTPEIMIAASGPDQGQTFLNTLNPLNAQDIMVPDGWSGAEQNPLSHVMVENYITKFGGTASDINADVAEAYSAGEVLADAVTATNSTDNAKIINYLHGNVTLQTVQGAVRFSPIGKNTAQQGFIYQWQNGRFLQVLGAKTNPATPLEPKPHWGAGG